MTEPAPPPSVIDLPQLCDVAGVEDESRQLLSDDRDVRAFLAALLGADRHADAVRLLAHLLPRREAIFWAWSSVRRVLPPEPPPAVAVAVEATGRWIAEPVEANRRPTLELAEAAGLGTAAGCAALAVFLSGGSIAPPEVEVVEPEPFAASKAIAGAVILAAVSAEPERAPERFGESITQGLDIGRRVGLWPADAAAV
jgi:hypothetical protein